MTEIHLSSRLKLLYPNIEITLKQNGKVQTICSIDGDPCLRDGESEADFSYIPEGENFMITVLFTAYSDCCVNCVRNSTKKDP